MLMNPSLMFEMRAVACLVKEEAPVRSGWFNGSKRRKKGKKSWQLIQPTHIVPYAQTTFLPLFRQPNISQ